MSKTYTYFIALVGVVCVVFLTRLFFFFDLSSRTVRSDVVQGVLIGAGLAFATAQVYGRLKGTKTNGWVTMYGCGEPGNGMFLRAAQALMFVGPICVPAEAMYWWANADSVQFTDPSKNINFAYVGKRATGTKAGDYLITGLGWKGSVPQGMKQISSPNNEVLVIGRVFVEKDSDILTAYDLGKQIQLMPLSG